MSIFSLVRRLKRSVLTWCAALYYAHVPEEDRCPNHPDYPGLGEHAFRPTYRQSVLTGYVGMIGQECERCPAIRLGTVFMVENIAWLEQRGAKDKVSSWIGGTWVPETFLANLPKGGGK